MPGLVDLHCHWLAGVDDGARTPVEGREILTRLERLGFDEVIATPHMRPGLFDNSAESLRVAFAASGQAAGSVTVHLSSEHYFDDTVVQRIQQGEALPYPGGKAILLEFYEVSFSPAVERQLFRMLRGGLTPVIAHPERYRPLWESPTRLERLIDLGCLALLDAAALVGKYGEQVRRCALTLLEAELYAAACSDAHRPGDVDELEQAMEWIDRHYGAAELDFLLREGPRQVLAGGPSG